MEHLDTGTLESWYANRAKPVPTLLHRLAVIAPDDSPGLYALRQRLAQRGPQSLNCDHFAAGFNGTASVSLASAFEQIRQRHQSDPYDIVLLLDGQAEALGIAESNGLIPEQVSRMPAAVWTAIGEDDANTELGDVANRVFPNPGALIDALPLPGVEPQGAAVRRDPEPEPTHRPIAAPGFTLVTTPDHIAPVHVPTLPSQHAPATHERAGAHPLVLCAAGAIIVASMTAMAAMLGWLPSRVQANISSSERPATTVTRPADAALTTTPATGKPSVQASVVNAVDNAVAMPPATPNAVPQAEPEAGPAAALPSIPSSPQGSSRGESTALAVAGAAGLMAATPRAKAASVSAKRAKRVPRRTPEPLFETARAPRQVGSTEVPAVDFVGTKSRQQVIAELMEARRTTNRQAANGNYFPIPGGPSARR